MNDREFRCIKQRVETNLESHADAVTLVNEVSKLRQELREIFCLVNDPDLARSIQRVLEIEP